MDSIIIKSFNKYGPGLGLRLGVDKPYFFLDTEIVTDLDDYTRLKRIGGIRHCILTRHGYFDYIKKMYFDTLETWAADCGSDISYVCFGENRRWQRWGKAVKMPLAEVLEILDPKKKTVEQVLLEKKLTTNDLWVMLNNTLVKFSCMSV